MERKMEQNEKRKLLRQLVWDYNISADDIEAVLKGIKDTAGPFTREKLLIRMLESYPWFTIIQLISIEDIHRLLTRDMISRLRSQSLKEKYEFVRNRLKQIVSAPG